MVVLCAPSLKQDSAIHAIGGFHPVLHQSENFSSLMRKGVMAFTSIHLVKKKNKISPTGAREFA